MSKQRALTLRIYNEYIEFLAADPSVAGAAANAFVKKVGDRIQQIERAGKCMHSLYNVRPYPIAHLGSTGVWMVTGISIAGPARKAMLALLPSGRREIMEPALKAPKAERIRKRYRKQYAETIERNRGGKRRHASVKPKRKGSLYHWRDLLKPGFQF